MISYSGWGTFQKCQFKYRLRYRDKIKAPDQPLGPALIRGLRVHQSVEDFFNREREDVDSEINANYGQRFLAQREDVTYTNLPEYQWAVDYDWGVVGWEDEGMARGMYDCANQHYEGKTLHIDEYKTGKVYSDHKHQRSLYAASGSEIFEVDNVKVTTIYFDQKKDVVEMYNAKDLQREKDFWKNSIEMINITEPEDMIPNPTYLCRWCEYSKKCGGPCPF